MPASPRMSPTQIWQLVTRKQRATASLDLLAACRLTLGCNQAAWMVALFRKAHLPPGPEPSDRPHCDPPLLPRLPHPALTLRNAEQSAAMTGTAPPAPFPPLSLPESAINTIQQLLATYPDGEAAILCGSRAKAASAPPPPSISPCWALGSMPAAWTSIKADLDDLLIAWPAPACQRWDT